MKAYYVNRADREDRNYLFRGAMAAGGWRPEELVRIIAKHREDYPTRQAVCDAACADGFTGYFERMRGREYPGYGTLISTWSYLRSWRMIAEGDEIALFFNDDYYLKQPKSALEFLLAPLGDFNIVQLSWHTRDAVFFFDKFNLGIPYEHAPEEVSDKSPHFLEGAWHGCADRALVLSPAGADALLTYMDRESPIDTECATMAFQHTHRDFPGIYSLKDQPRDVDGNTVLRTNQWIGHLIEYTDGPVSNLMGTHMIPDMKPQDALWDERMDNPYGRDKKGN